VVDSSIQANRAKVEACGYNLGCLQGHNLGTPTECLTAQPEIVAQVTLWLSILNMWLNITFWLSIALWLSTMISFDMTLLFKKTFKLIITCIKQLERL